MNRRVPVWFVFPAIVFFLLIRIYPMLQSFFYSFTNWNGMTAFSFVGLTNFRKLFNDPSVANSLSVTIRFAVVVVLSVNILGLALALALNKAGRLTTLFRSLIFLPVVISQVAVGFVWKNLYAFNGLLNQVFMSIGASSHPIGWLTDPTIAIYSVAATEIWRATGFHMVIILAALQTIPKELYEAADIDGCSPWHRFSRITMPLIVPTFGVSVILSTIGSLKQFSLVKILTDGGPLRATETVSLKILDEAFNYNFQGYASSLAVLLFLMTFVLVFAQRVFSAKRESRL